jgi:hypothetical protein
MNWPLEEDDFRFRQRGLVFRPCLNPTRSIRGAPPEFDKFCSFGHTSNRKQFAVYKDVEQSAQGADHHVLFFCLPANRTAGDKRSAEEMSDRRMPERRMDKPVVCSGGEVFSDGSIL